MSTQQPPANGIADPMAAREAAKYEFPVPSREAVLALLAERGEPLSFRRLTEALAVEGERDIESFSRRLRAMERDGQILRNRRGRYGLVEKMDMVHGRVLGHPEGFGFLRPDEGGDDLFLSPFEMRQVLHGDRVVARATRVDARGRKEAAIIEVVERQQRQVVGRYLIENLIGVVVPDDKRVSQDIFIPAGNEGDAAPGQIVTAEIVQPPTRHSQPIGRIVEVLGDHMAPGMEIEIALRKYDLPRAWSPQVEREIAGLDPAVAEVDKQGREDLRHLPLVTIDGEDARDFDDAVYAERRGKGWRLVVAIADVSHYVRPGTPLDSEAYVRGNSVYFPNNVIPMLPEILSNGLCSLNPEVDRLCMVCEMNLNARAKVEEYCFYPAVMRSRARLTYTQVAAMLVDGEPTLRREHDALVPHLENLYAVYKLLHKAREGRGSVDFELPETRIIYNDQRKIERIVPLIRNDAHKLIEECMLAANVCAGDFLSQHEMPGLYRIHAGPTPEKLTDLRQFLAELGLELGGGDEPQAKDYAALLRGVEEGPQGRLIQAMLLRSLSQAMYSHENIGHFALAYHTYTHFTSPIRRYPDLLVHRAIKGILGAHPPGDGDLARMQSQAEHCSMTERRADDATRDVVRWLKTEYMMDKIGEEFDGIVSGVTNFGLFVELADIYVDGLVHISSLGNDYYHFDPAKQRLLGERTRQSYRLGDSVRVRLVRASLDDAKLDFELVAKTGELALPDGDKPARRVRSQRKKKTRQRR